MSKLGLLRASIRSTLAAGTSRPHHHGLLVLLREPLSWFSTQAEQPPHDAAVDRFIHNTNTGPVYGRLVRITRNTSKTDALNLLEGCDLTLEDIKVQYNAACSPMGIILRFPSQRAYDNALKVLRRKAQDSRLERSDPQRWERSANETNYDGKTVLIEGLHKLASQEDVVRFLSGTPYLSSSIQMFLRPGFPDPIRLAIVRFPSKIQAMSACIAKNKGFIQNNQVLTYVLH